jgi:hypothetical protein
VTKLTPPTEHRKRRPACPPVPLAVRHVARRWRMPLPTAALVAQAAGLNVGADR